MIFGPMNYFLVTDGQTEGDAPCMSTGGLKNQTASINSTFYNMNYNTDFKKKIVQLCLIN